MEGTLERLSRRLAEINEELRCYPQPIARCDAQLGGLLAEREDIQAALEQARKRHPAQGGP